MTTKNFLNRLRYISQSYARLCELESLASHKTGAEAYREIIQAALDDIHDFSNSVKTWLASLPKNQSQLIRLKYFQNKTWKEVAAIYGCSVKEGQMLSKIALSR